jgi:hypothetical protein
MMPMPKAWTATARGLLANQLDRLRDFLTGLGRGLRDRLAGAAGEAVAAVLRALLEDAETPYRPPPRRWYPERETPSWRDEVEDTWRDEPEEYYAAAPVEVPANPGTGWRPTLAAALQLASWWLRRPVEGLPGRAALAAGIAAGVATLAGVPLGQSRRLLARLWG